MNTYYKGCSKIMQVKLFLSHCLYLICTNFSWFALKIFSIYLEVGQVVPESTHPLGLTRPWVNSHGSTCPVPICIETLHTLTDKHVEKLLGIK